MKVIKARGLEHVRTQMASETVVMTYFDNIEQCLRKNGLLDQPHLIYNIDEIGVTIHCQHKPPHIVPSAVTSGKGNTVTILCAGGARGSAIHPYLTTTCYKVNRQV